MEVTDSNLACEQAVDLKRGPLVGVAMADDADTGSEGGFIHSLLNPGRTASTWFFGLGSWILLLGILNVLVVAHPGGKISWVGFLSLGNLGEILMTDSVGQGFHVIGDGFFLGLGLILVGIGAKGLNSGVEGGMAAWLKGLFVNDLWPALMSTEEGGWRRTISSWLLAIGFIFYFYWGLSYNNWVDPGTYAVSVALIGFGFAFLAMPEEDGEPAPLD
jgi:hypothetical protein